MYVSSINYHKSMEVQFCKRGTILQKKFFFPLTQWGCPSHSVSWPHAIDKQNGLSYNKDKLKLHSYITCVCFFLNKLHITTRFQSRNCLILLSIVYFVPTSCSKHHSIKQVTIVRKPKTQRVNLQKKKKN